MPRGRKRKLRKLEKPEVSVKVTRVDRMKPQEADLSQRPKVEGGMAHSGNNEVMWGGKVPPLPRNELAKKTRSGLALKKV